jgi:hypothetical protein
MRDNILIRISKQLSSTFDKELIDKLLKHYQKVKENFILMKYEPAELNAGKFCEIVFRMLQNISTVDRSYLKLGKAIKNFETELKAFEALDGKNFHDSIRVHIPRLMRAIYDIRNRRGVGHVGGDIDSNYQDSILVMTCCDWIFIELLRLFYTSDLDEAQKIVERLIERKIPVVTVVGDFRRVLNPKLDYSQKVLAILYHEYPGKASDSDLFKWTEHTNLTVFKKRILRRLHREAKIHWRDGECRILPPGLKNVEADPDAFRKWE